VNRNCEFCVTVTGLLVFIDKVIKGVRIKAIHLADKVHVYTQRRTVEQPIPGSDATDDIKVVTSVVVVVCVVVACAVDDIETYADKECAKLSIQ